MDPQVKAALITAAVAAAGILLGRLWSRLDKHNDVAQLFNTGLIQDGIAFRQDLLKEVTALRDEIEEVKRDRDERQVRYQKLQEEHAALKLEHEGLRREQQRWLLDKAEMERRIEALTVGLGKLREDVDAKQ